MAPASAQNANAMANSGQKNVTRVPLETEQALPVTWCAGNTHSVTNSALGAPTVCYANVARTVSCLGEGNRPSKGLLRKTQPLCQSADQRKSARFGGRFFYDGAPGTARAAKTTYSGAIYLGLAK
jgi:hypothetical protein